MVDYQSLPNLIGCVEEPVMQGRRKSLADNARLPVLTIIRLT